MSPWKAKRVNRGDALSVSENEPEMFLPDLSFSSQAPPPLQLDQPLLPLSVFKFEYLPKTYLKSQVPLEFGWLEALLLPTR